MTDYQLTKMKDVESIEAFNARFQILSQSISSEEKEIIKLLVFFTFFMGKDHSPQFIIMWLFLVTQF